MRLAVIVAMALFAAACSGSRPVPTPVSTADVTGVPGTAQAGPDGFVPNAIAFADAEHGWVSGSTGGRAAFVLETRDGGRTWSTSQVGSLVATAIAPAPERPWVSTPCPDDESGCSPALRHLSPDGSWEPVGSVAPLSIDGIERTGAVALIRPGGPRQPSGMPIPAIQVTSDAGRTWAVATNPCGGLDLEALSTPSATELLVLCGGQGAGGGQEKALLVSEDRGTSWTVRASTGDGLSMAGTNIGFDIAADGSGLWWGPRTSAMATSDAGRTWQTLGAADGEVRIAASGAALGGGAGYLLVGDGDRGVSVLLWTNDGKSWEERVAWPDPPCCGG